MDLRVWVAVHYLKQARTCLGLGRGYSRDGISSHSAEHVRNRTENVVAFRPGRVQVQEHLLFAQR